MMASAPPDEHSLTPDEYYLLISKQDSWPRWATERATDFHCSNSDFGRRCAPGITRQELPLVYGSMTVAKCEMAGLSGEDDFAWITQACADTTCDAVCACMKGQTVVSWPFPLILHLESSPYGSFLYQLQRNKQPLIFEFAELNLQDPIEVIAIDPLFRRACMGELLINIILRGVESVEFLHWYAMAGMMSGYDDEDIFYTLYWMKRLLLALLPGAIVGQLPRWVVEMDLVPYLLFNLLAGDSTPVTQRLTY